MLTATIESDTKEDDLQDNEWYRDTLKELYGENFDSRYIKISVYNSGQLAFHGLIAEENRENEFVCFQDLYVLVGFLSLSLSIKNIHESPIQLYLMKSDEKKASYQGYISDISTRTVINIYVSNTSKTDKNTMYFRVKTQTQKEFLQWVK